MPGEPSIVVLLPMDVVSPSSSIDLAVGNFGFAPPYLRFVIPHCFFRAIPTTERLMTRLFSPVRRSCSSLESDRSSCGMSRWRMTMRVAWRIFVFENYPPTLSDKSSAHVFELVVQHLSGSTWLEGSFQAFCTASAKPDNSFWKRRLRPPASTPIDAYDHLYLLFNIGLIRTYIKPPEATTHIYKTW